MHNHYKRISVVDAQRSADERMQSIMEGDGAVVGQHPGVDGPFSDLHLGQFGRSGMGNVNGAGTENPFDDVRSINAPENDMSAKSGGRSVDDCELDKSNIW